MAGINYKSNQVKLNIPNKVLSVNVTSVDGYALWDYPNGSADPWWSGSPSKRYYQWRITFDVKPQPHGSHLTRDDFVYNGLDVVVGDWVAGSTTGMCCKIIAIESKTSNTVVAIVEDWLRFNTFKQPNGNGIFNTGSAVVFTLNENGEPILHPLPATVSYDFYPAVSSRFQYLNPQMNYVLKQPSHNFTRGDVVAVTSSGFSVANATTMSRMIGVVNEDQLGPDWFMMVPNKRIIDYDPIIPGQQGDYVYVDSNGTLTATSNAGQVIFLKIQAAIPTVLRGTVSTPTVPSGHTVQFNGVPVIFSSASPNTPLNEIVSHINAKTPQHFVTASAVDMPNTVTSSLTLNYQLIGGYLPFAAYFDTGSGNTLVNFTTSGMTYDGVASARDIKLDIDNAHIANLSVTSSDSSITLTEINGNAIVITNAVDDANAVPFAGDNSISGLPLVTPETNTQVLLLERLDGGEILIFENTEFFRVQTGIASGHTGMLPLAINIEGGLRSSSSTVVADLVALQVLAPQLGDMAFVINKGDGEWGLFVYDGFVWVQTSNADSATTDAKTLTTTFTLPIAGAGVSTTQNLGNISPSRKITNISVKVDEELVGFSQEPGIEVGTSLDPDQFMNVSQSDLTEENVYVSSPEYVYPSSNAQDMIVRVRLNHYGATSGTVTVKLTYV